jgi:hypothetical protein
MLSDGIKFGPGNLSSWFHVCKTWCALVVFMKGGLEGKERGRHNVESPNDMFSHIQKKHCGTKRKT